MLVLIREWARSPAVSAASGVRDACRRLVRAKAPDTPPGEISRRVGELLRTAAARLALPAEQIKWLVPND